MMEAKKRKSLAPLAPGGVYPVLDAILSVPATRYFGTFSWHPGTLLSWRAFFVQKVGYFWVPCWHPLNCKAPGFITGGLTGACALLMPSMIAPSRPRGKYYDGCMERVNALLERAGPYEVLVRVSNDRKPDAYGTIITAEALIEWLTGYLEHRTVNLQHSRPMRGIPGKPLVGYAIEADFAPDLLVRVRVVDPEASAMIAEGRVKGASIEFSPLDAYRLDDGTVVYTRVSGEPELTGLALVDLPAVPGADILEVRGAPLGLWAYAVVDPIVWERGMPIEEAMRYAYLPHHRPDRTVDLKAFEQAYSAVMSGAIPYTKGGKLTEEEVYVRAKEHLDRHLNGLLVRGIVPSNPPRYGRDEESSWQAPSLRDFGAEDWESLSREEKVRIAQHFAWAPKMPPDRFTDLKLPHHDPETGAVVWRGVVAAMAALLGARGGVDIPDEDRPRVYQHLAQHYREFGREPPPLEEGRTATGDAKLNPGGQTMEKEKLEANKQEPAGEDVGIREAPTQGAKPEADLEAHGVGVDLDALVARTVEAVIEKLQAPKAVAQRAYPEGTGPVIRMPKLSRDEAVREVLYRTVGRMAMGLAPEVDQARAILREAGLSERAIDLSNAGSAVISQELAASILLKPHPSAIWRSHFPPRPIAGTKKAQIVQANVNVQVAFNGATLNETTATHTEKWVEVHPLQAYTQLKTDFSTFNILGPSWVDQVLMPEFRAALAEAEDMLFFQGGAPLPGLLLATGAVDVVLSAIPTDPLEYFTAAWKALPGAYRKNRSQLRFYAKTAIVDALIEAVAKRQSVLGDAVLQGGAASTDAPMPAARVLGVDVYYAPSLDTQNSVNTVLVWDGAVYSAQGMSLQVRTFPVPGFLNRIELEEYIGYAFPLPDGIVRVKVNQ